MNNESDEVLPLESKAAQLLLDHVGLFRNGALPGPILDLASGSCHNGIFLAGQGLPVICADRSKESLERAKKLAGEAGVTVTCWGVDLEESGVNPLPEDYYGGIIVFRYLHRPLMDCIKKALKDGGILLYETFTYKQPFFGKPNNPNYLLETEELRTWFKGWNILYYFEGIRDDPLRAVAQIVCKKE